MSNCLIDCLGKSAHDALFVSTTYVLSESMKGVYGSHIVPIKGSCLKTTANVVTFVAFCSVAVVALAELVVRFVQGLIVCLAALCKELCCGENDNDELDYLTPYVFEAVGNTLAVVSSPLEVMQGLFCASDS